jgi:hypothetical protein
LGHVRHPVGPDEINLLFGKLEWSEQRAFSMGRWKVGVKTE